MGSSAHFCDETGLGSGSPVSQCCFFGMLHEEQELEDQFVFHRKKHGGCPTGDPDLVVNVLQVVRDRPFADDQALSNLAVGVAFGDVLQDFHLPVGEARGPFVPRARL